MKKALTQYERIELIEMCKKDMDLWAEQAALIAKSRSIAYKAYLAEGFTPEQALELCSKPL